MDQLTPSALEQKPAGPIEDLKKPEVKKPVRPPKPKRWPWVLLVLAILAVPAYFYWPQIKALIPSAPAAPTTGGRGRGGGGVIPVVTAQARTGTIQVFYTGLGAVTPIYTVNVKSRVDGEIMTVAYKEGQLVHKGDTLLQIDPRPYQVALEQAEGQLAKDEANLKNALVDLERYKVLLKQEAVPEQQYATQEALVTQDQGVIKSDQAAVDAAKLNLVYAHITSPIDGIVGLRLVDPGNIVHATDTNALVVITQIDPISVIFTLAEDQLAPVLEKLHAGDHLPVQAWDRALTHKISDGTLDTTDNEIDPTTGTLRLRANFPNPDRKLFPSQFVNARLLVDTHGHVTLVNNAAVQRNSQSMYVWLVNPNNTVTIREVKVGTVEGDNAEILSGMQPGDQVVMVGVDKLQNGSRVNPQLQGAADGSSNAGAASGGKPGSKSGSKSGRGRGAAQTGDSTTSDAAPSAAPSAPASPASASAAPSSGRPGSGRHGRGSKASK